MNNYEKVSDKCQLDYLLRQTAEECAELGHAALKLVRAYKEETPMTAEEAEDHFVEEVGDVCACIRVLERRGLDMAIVEKKH